MPFHIIQVSSKWTSDIYCDWHTGLFLCQSANNNEISDSEIEANKAW